jgi:hypothetical protein
MHSEAINPAVSPILRILPASAALMAILLDRPLAEMQSELRALEACGLIRRRVCSLTRNKVYVPILRVWAGPMTGTEQTPVPRKKQAIRQYKFKVTKLAMETA